MELNYQPGQRINLTDNLTLSIIEEIYPYNPITGRVLYRVKDNVTGLFFALKCFNLKLNSENDIMAEMVAVNKLDNSNVFPRVIRYTKQGEFSWLLLDWINGYTLTKAYKNPCTERLDFSIRIGMLAEICHAVSRIHEKRLLHRDLKPCNIIVKDPKQPKKGVAIIDFGLSALRRQNIEGTIGFQPPEQEGVRNFNLGAQADVFSLGQIGWQLVTGETRLAFPNLSFDGWDEPLPDLLGISPMAPPKLAHILRRAMAFKPAERYSHAGQMFHEVRGVRS